jgi:tRNA pseudouridine55 synthase
LDKPNDFGSTKAVGRVRWLYQAQKAGHAGTLDPLATGILPIALGDATKTAPYLVDAEKAYAFTVSFGEETTTGDVEGEVSATSDHRPTESDIRAALPAFIGTITQTPPRFSAIKIDGQRAYDLARAGKEVDIPSREVRVDDLRLIAFDGESAELEVDCGKGTYVRSIARDLARALGTVGHVTGLRRTRVGPFTLDTAVTLETLEDDALRATALQSIHLSLQGLDSLSINADALHALGFGRAFPVDHPDTDEAVALYHDRAVAIGRVEGAHFHPRRVFSLPDTPE